MDYQTILTSLGLFFGFISMILFASDMIGLLDKIRNWNLLIRDKIQYNKTELAKVGLFAVLLLLLADIIKEFKLKPILHIIGSLLLVYIFMVIYFLNNKLLTFLEYLTGKLGKKNAGLLGVFFWFLSMIKPDTILNIIAYLQELMMHII